MRFNESLLKGRSSLPCCSSRSQKQGPESSFMLMIFLFKHIIGSYPATMMQELRQQRPRQEVQDPAEPPADPHFQWSRRRPTSKFQVMVQLMATSLFAKLPLLTGRNQHEARYVIQVTSMWSDLLEENWIWAFQRLNVYCIVAALGWLGACASSTAVTDFDLPPGMVWPQPDQPRQRTRRNNNRDQPAATANTTI